VACRVLIVDDDDVFAEMLCLLVADDPRFEIAARARDGAEAVALAEECDPDVITMDIDIPGMDGVEAARRILARDPTRRIVVLSASIFSERIQELRALGAVGYVSKSRAVEELREALLAACRATGFVDVR
jgi:DNA-binding NarL/FixJ family response regulator